MGSSHHLSFHLLLILFASQAKCSWSKDDLHKSYKIQFHHGAETEKDLEECQDNYSPCSVIQNPFFYPFRINRLCRCKRKPCPETFEVRKSLDTVFINNREQIKFCHELPKCHGGWGILRVGAEDDIPYHLNCYCPARRRYWRSITAEEALESSEEKSITLDDQLKDEVPEWKTYRTERHTHAQVNNSIRPIVVAAIPTKLYKCEKMEPCTNSSCGTLRMGLFATYQNCTCATNSLCLPSRTPMTRLNEVMNSNGFGRNSFCVRRSLPSKTGTSAKWDKTERRNI